MAIPCTTRTLIAYHNFRGELQKKGLEVETKIEVRTQRNIEVS